jgi:hypothetical protein
MATAEQTSYRVLSLPEQARGGDDDRVRIGLRRNLDIGAFGANAIFQAQTGGEVIGERDELGPGSDGQEELYVAVQGNATFTVDGDEIDAQHGTIVSVPPGTTRKAVATSDETIVLAVGGRRGKAYRLPPSAELHELWQHYNDKDYEGALAACHVALEKFPGNARKDDDFASLREDPRFVELIA